VQELSGGTPTANLVTGLDLDEFFTRTDGAGVRNYLSDAMGSSVALTDGSGTIQSEYTYEPFGATTLSRGSTSSANGFTGRENDGTGFYLLLPGAVLPSDRAAVCRGRPAGVWRG